MQSVRRRLLIAGCILAACAFAGGAYAASSENTSPRQAFLNDVAKRLHVSPQQLKSAFLGATEDQLRAAVKAGRLTQTQANAIEKRLRNGGPPALPFFGPGLRRHGLLGPGPLPPAPGLLPRLAIVGFGPLAAATHYLGLTPAALFKQLSSRKSLAQITRAHGKSVSGLESAIIAAERSRLDRARSRGLITSSQEQKLLSAVRARVAAVVNQKGGFLPPFAPPGTLRFKRLRMPPYGPPNGPLLRPKMVPPLGGPAPGALSPS